MLATATIAYDLADHIGTDFDFRRTKVEVYTSVPDQTIIDTADNKIRLGGGKGTLNSDGTGSVTVWTPGAGSVPTSWQTYLRVDYMDTATRERKTKTFGPYTITASADLANLEAEQGIPPVFENQLTMDAYLAQTQAAAAEAEAAAGTAAADAAAAVADETAADATAADLARVAAEAARDDAVDISGISTSDGVVEALVKNTGGAGPLTSAALSDTLVPRKTTASQESATVAANIASSAGWTLGSGWTGDYATGFTKVAGTDSPLTWTPPENVAGGTYLVEWVWEGDAGQSADQWIYGAYDVTLGDGSAGIIYQGVDFNYSRAIKPTTNGALVFQPWTGYNFGGRIHSISVRKVTATAAIGVGFTNSLGTRVSEVRFGPTTAPNSVFFGVNAGRWNVTGARNVGIGYESLGANVTGFFNVGVGHNSLASNVNGTRNVGIGYAVLASNVSGDRNVGIGPFALNRVTTGQRNVAVGVDNFWRLTDGNDNIGLGYLSATEIEHGSENVAIGRYAMRNTNGASNGSTSNNVAIGTEALGHVLSADHVAIGTRALASQSLGAGGNVAIGKCALENANTSQEVAIGKESSRYMTGGRNTAIGHAALKGVEGASTGQRNVAIGDNAGVGVTTGSNNTIVGPSSAATLTTGSNNILIGFAVGPSAAGASNEMNIGSTLYADLSSKRVGIGRSAPLTTAALHIKAGAATAGDAPLKLTTGPVLTTPEAGAFEYDGTNLYFTPTAGVRKTVTLA